jgi:hypothetical protein
MPFADSDTPRGYAPPHNVAAQGLEVSLGHILEHLLLQRQLGHQPLQLAVFSFRRLA